MRSQGCTVSKVPRDNLCKNNAEKQFLSMCYMYIQSTDKGTNSKLKFSKPLTIGGGEGDSKTVFFHSLCKHTHHTANVVLYTPYSQRCPIHTIQPTLSYTHHTANVVLCTPYSLSLIHI